MGHVAHMQTLPLPCHVNVNNSLEVANQSVHDIGFKHKPYVINVCKWYFYDRQLDRASTSPSFVNLYINSSQRCQNVSGTFIFDSPLFFTIPSTEAHQIVTNNQHVWPLWPLLCTKCIFFIPALAARNNFDRAVATVSLKLNSSNSTTCSSVIEYELYGGF